MPIVPPVHLTPQLLDTIRYALAEDDGYQGDITCLPTIPSETKARAQFLVKADGIIAVIDLAEMIFWEVDPELKVKWHVQEGDEVKHGIKFGTVNDMLPVVLIGAGETHRMGLEGMVMVKDNILMWQVASQIRLRSGRLHQKAKIDVGVEMETRTSEEVQAVLDCIISGRGRVTRIMLDNMVKRLPEGGVDVSMHQQAVRLTNGLV